MATTEQPYSRVAEAVVGDIDRTAVAAAEEVLPKGGPGASRTTHANTVAHVRALWPYPELRQSLFHRLVPSVQGPDGRIYPARNGLAHWESLVRAAFPLGYPEPPRVAGAGFAPGPGFAPPEI